MSRTHLIARTDTLINVESNQHQMASAVERAILNGTQPDNPMRTQFTFDLIDTAKGITVKRLKDDVLSRLSFTVDMQIASGLSRMLNDYYQHSKGDGTTPTYPNYQSFLAYIEGMEQSEASLYETGCDVQPLAERLYKLVALRNEIHSVIASQMGNPTTYVMPDMRDVISAPRMRSLSASAEEGLRSIVEDDTDDEELRKELLAQYLLDDKLERVNQFRMDQMKVQALLTLWSCLKVQDHAIVTDEDDAFFGLDVRTQFSLLNTFMRAVTDTRRRAVTDNRLPVMEKATLRVEAKALMTQLTAALEHPVFSDLAV